LWLRVCTGLQLRLCAVLRLQRLRLALLRLRLRAAPRLSPLLPLLIAVKTTIAPAVPGLFLCDATPKKKPRPDTRYKGAAQCIIPATPGIKRRDPAAFMTRPLALSLSDASPKEEAHRCEAQGLARVTHAVAHPRPRHRLRAR